MASSSIAMLQKTANCAAADECYTPPDAVLPLLQYLDRGKTWYEASSGISKSIVTTMTDNGFRCDESDGDFFLQSDVRDGIVTNPPYSQKDKWISRCYDLGKPWALLLPVSAFQGQKRGEMFSKHGVDVLVLNKRPNFTGGSGAHFGVAWFTWGILPERLIFH